MLFTIARTKVPSKNHTIQISALYTFRKIYDKHVLLTDLTGKHTRMILHKKIKTRYGLCLFIL